MADSDTNLLIVSACIGPCSLAAAGHSPFPLLTPKWETCSSASLCTGDKCIYLGMPLQGHFITVSLWALAARIQPGIGQGDSMDLQPNRFVLLFLGLRLSSNGCFWRCFFYPLPSLFHFLSSRKTFLQQPHLYTAEINNVMTHICWAWV